MASIINRSGITLFKKALAGIRCKHTLPTTAPIPHIRNSKAKLVDKKWTQPEIDTIYSIELPLESKGKLGRKSKTRDAERARLAAELLPGRTYLAIFLKICQDRRNSNCSTRPV